MSGNRFFIAFVYVEYRVREIAFGAVEHIFAIDNRLDLLYTIYNKELSEGGMRRGS